MARAKSNELTRLVKEGLRLNEYMAHTPTEKQGAALLLSEIEELFYGGAGGGGKSDYLLMAALQYVDVPGYSAGLFRRKFSDLTKPNGLIDRSHAFLGGTDARWTGQNHRWTFPSGAMLSFGGCEHMWDVYDYASSEYQYIGFDELVDFMFKQYQFLRTRLRRLMGMPVPLRVRGGSNPPDEEQTDGDWVKDYFVDPPPDDKVAAERVFIQAFLSDNPHVDAEAYKHSLEHHDPVIVDRIIYGDWTVRVAGMMFQRQWFEIIEALPADVSRVCRAWDKAATKPARGKAPDWTVGLLMLKAGNLYIVADVIRVQQSPAETEALMKQTAAMDALKWGDLYMIREEQEGGSSGIEVVDKRTVEMAGYDYGGTAPRKSKPLRARPVAVQAKAGNVKLLKGAWNKVYLDEHERFPASTFDDQVDAESLAFSSLANPTDNVIEYLKMQAEKAKGMQHVRPRA